MSWAEVIEKLHEMDTRLRVLEAEAERDHRAAQRLRDLAQAAADSDNLAELNMKLRDMEQIDRGGHRAQARFPFFSPEKVTTGLGSTTGPIRKKL